MARGEGHAEGVAVGFAEEALGGGGEGGAEVVESGFLVADVQSAELPPAVAESFAV